MKADLIDFKIQPNLNVIRSKFKNSFKKYVKIKAMEFEFSQLTQQKTHNSKIAGLSYNKLEMQTYFNLENMSAAQAKIVYSYRTRMASYGEHFRVKNGQVMCPMCGLHKDSQSMAFNNCQVIKEEVSIYGKYEDIFQSVISSKLAASLENIDKIRKTKTE